MTLEDVLHVSPEGVGLQRADRVEFDPPVFVNNVVPFDAKSLEIAQMFADQSVIAIENARLLSDARSGSDVTREMR